MILTVAGLSLLAISSYGGDLAAAEQKFFLKYLLSSQSAILWMGVMFVVATVAYWIGLVGRSPTASFVGTALTWGAVVMGFAGMFIRWYESYLIGPDVGHIPVSNLYEVFVLFALITAMYYLFYEQVYKTRQLGAFVMLVVVAAVVVVHQTRNVGLCLRRPVKHKKSFLFFVLEFKLDLELELGLGLKLE